MRREHFNGKDFYVMIFLFFLSLLIDTRVSEAEKQIRRLIFMTGPCSGLQSTGLKLVMVSCLVDFAFHNFLSAEFKPGRLSVSRELSHKLSVDISADIFILVGRVFRRCRAHLAVCSFVCTEHLSGLIFSPRHEI